jgi:hypothetical protein
MAQKELSIIQLKSNIKKRQKKNSKSKLKTIIFGGCVTRDAFELIDNNQFHLIGYFARSSLASAYTIAPFPKVNLTPIKSTFQKRILSHDLNKTFAHFINDNTFDLIIYDPLVERFNLLQLASGELCTLSNEMLKTDISHLSKNSKTIISGTDQFYYLWEKGWSSFIKQLDQLACRKCLRVNKIFWATHSEDGQDYLPIYSAERIKNENNFLEKLYQRMAYDLEEEQFYVVDKNPIGANEHKWGRAPFHYRDDFYKKFIEKLTDTL